MLKEQTEIPYSTLFIRITKAWVTWVTSSWWVLTLMNWSTIHHSNKRSPKPFPKQAFTSLGNPKSDCALAILLMISWDLFYWKSPFTPIFHCVLNRRHSFIFTAFQLTRPLLQRDNLLPRELMQNAECQPTVYLKWNLRYWGFIWSKCSAKYPCLLTRQNRNRVK